MSAAFLGAAAAAVVLLWWVPPRVPWTPTAPRGDGRDEDWDDSWGGATGEGWEESGGVGQGRSGPLGTSAEQGGVEDTTARGARGEGTSLVPEALELLALALQGGGSLGDAAAGVAGVLPRRRADQLARVARTLRSGVDTAGAWAEAGPDWEPARRALELAQVAGVPPGPALRQAATDLRRDAVADVEVATARLGVRLVLPLGLTFLPAFVLITVLPLVLALTRDLAW